MSIKGKQLTIILSILLLCALSACGGKAPTPTPTATSTRNVSLLPTQYPYAPYRGTLILSDPLKDNSKGYQWDETTAGNASCGFSKAAYHIKAGAKGAILCFPEAPKLSSLSNFTYEVSLKTIQGEAEGIALRFDQTASTGYLFLIDTLHGTYGFSAVNGSSPARTIFNGKSKAIIQGLDQANLLAVVADGSTISLYVNHQLVAKTDDNTYNQGQLGIFTVDIQTPADIEANNARAWTF